MLFLTLSLYFLGIILTFVYLVETQKTSDSDQRMIMFCCSLAFPIYTLYLLYTRITYFIPATLEIEDSPTPEKLESFHYGF